MLQVLLAKRFEGFVGADTAPVLFLKKFIGLNSLTAISADEYNICKGDDWKIKNFYLLEKDSLKKFHDFLLGELNAIIDYLIVTPPEISEDELELDGTYRKYQELKGVSVLLDRHTKEGETYYMLLSLLENIAYEIGNNGGFGIVFVKNDI